MMESDDLFTIIQELSDGLWVRILIYFLPSTFILYMNSEPCHIDGYRASDLSDAVVKYPRY